MQVALCHREQSPDMVEAHVGIDGGQGWLKIGLTISGRQEAVRTGRASYSEVIVVRQNMYTIEKLLEQL